MTSSIIPFNLEDLTTLLVNAKIHTYAGEGKEVTPERPGFKELEFSEEDWNYRDSYAGFYLAPGQEIVRFKGTPVWAMAYSGGMVDFYYGDLDFAQQTFRFLKQALRRVERQRPFRGPSLFREGDYVYTDQSEGGLPRFRGREKIFHLEQHVFQQDYIGGLILPK